MAEWNEDELYELEMTSTFHVHIEGDAGQGYFGDIWPKMNPWDIYTGNTSHGVIFAKRFMTDIFYPLGNPKNNAGQKVFFPAAYVKALQNDLKGSDIKFTFSYNGAPSLSNWKEDVAGTVHYRGVALGSFIQTMQIDYDKSLTPGHGPLKTLENEHQTWTLDNIQSPTMSTAM